MKTVETAIAQFEITPDELFTAEQIAEAARNFGLIPATRKERVLPPSLTFNGTHQWTTRAARRDPPAAVRGVPGGQSVKPFIATPKDGALRGDHRASGKRKPARSTPRRGSKNCRSRARRWTKRWRRSRREFGVDACAVTPPHAP
jgi:hypothetical protein